LELDPGNTGGKPGATSRLRTMRWIQISRQSPAHQDMGCCLDVGAVCGQCRWRTTRRAQHEASLAVEAVHVEPFSGANSLRAGN